MKAFLIRDIPDDIHQALKMQAVKKKVSLKDLIIKVLVEAAEDKGKGKKAA